LKSHHLLIKEEPNIEVSSNNFSALLRVVLKNKESTIELLKDLTKLDIIDFEFDDLKNMGDSSGYDFSTIKLKAYLENNEIEIYVKMIRKDRIKESIFCYWSLLYDEKFKDYEKSEFTSIISKVRITEKESEKYKHSVLLEILENRWGILECGTTIHLVKFQKYLSDETIKKANLIKEWEKYVKHDNEDVLFLGVINK